MDRLEVLVVHFAVDSAAPRCPGRGCSLTGKYRTASTSQRAGFADSLIRKATAERGPSRYELLGRAFIVALQTTRHD